MGKWLWVALVIASMAYAANLAIDPFEEPNALPDPMYSSLQDKQLFDYVMQGNAQGVVQALSEGANAAATDKHGCTTTTFAASYEDPTILQLLLDAGAPADPVISGEELEEVWKKTQIVPGLHRGFGMYKNNLFAPLAIAAVEGNYESVVILLEAGAKIDPWVEMERTALDSAIGGGSLQTVTELLDWAADPNSIGRWGEGPVWLAHRLGEDEMVKLLISKGTDVDSRSMTHGTLLGSACSNGDVEMARCLLENGTDVNTRNHWGMDILEHEVRVGDIEMLCLLLDYGATPTTELQAIANEVGNIEVARLLEANLNPTKPGTSNPHD